MRERRQGQALGSPGREIRGRREGGRGGRGGKQGRGGEGAEGKAGKGTPNKPVSPAWEPPQPPCEVPPGCMPTCGWPVSVPPGRMRTPRGEVPVWGVSRQVVGALTCCPGPWVRGGRLPATLPTRRVPPSGPQALLCRLARLSAAFFVFDNFFIKTPT